MLYVLVIIVALYGLVQIGQSTLRLWKLGFIVKTEQSALDEALERIEVLEMEIERLSSDLEYIEKIAREEYGMIREGEEMFRISTPETEVKGK